MLRRLTVAPRALSLAMLAQAVDEALELLRLAIGEVESFVYDLIPNVRLANATATRIVHRLGRQPRGVIVVRSAGATSAGYLNHGTYDDESVTLTATGYGATLTVTLLVL